MMKKPAGPFGYFSQVVVSVHHLPSFPSAELAESYPRMRELARGAKTTILCMSPNTPMDDPHEHIDYTGLDP